ncbi:MAG: N-6 DNA methylase, partial [bacterium]|nr:N-6 DNA methylase [bacterium]
RNYSVAGLYGRLREDAGRYPDTMDQRYGAWAWLLSLFRLVFDGGGHGVAGGGGFHLPTRHGQLFNPDEYPFLEGRRQGVARVQGDRFEAPKVSDGCIHRVLEALLILDGERLSYRALDVEQIGSVYEAMMGFEVERAFGRSIAAKPKHVVFDVDKLLEVEAGKRKKWLKDRAECDLTGKSLAALKNAATPEDVVAALGRKISPRTPRLLPPGALYLQPGEERRRSGSHYTPRELTEPIVRTTLRPVLENLGERPTPAQILDLKVCDPAMGSGAFLVEACRQLAERLVRAWEIHDCMPEIPPDEDPLLHARRLVAQQCLYGVDKNPFAMSLAKLSLWLVTLARDHAFTFLDHALKCGDSLVGLTRAQIVAFDWKPKVSGQIDWIEEQMERDIVEALGWRDALQGLDEGDYSQKKEAWWEAENALADARLIGDLAVAAFFGADKDKAREELRNQYRTKMEAWRANEANRHELEGLVEALRGGEKPVAPMHWEIEFPEVFTPGKCGFDAIVGNPPFLGGTRITSTFGRAFRDMLALAHPEGSSNADLAAHFFRRSFSLLGASGCFGLLATNTIAQGDTRVLGLQAIIATGGVIFSTMRRCPWPGQAAVVVSIVHVQKPPLLNHALNLDGKPVGKITAFLHHSGPNEEPGALAANADKSFRGCDVFGIGFVFDDRNKNANSLSEMHELVSGNARNAERISPYLGGAEFNSSPTLTPTRYIIDFGEMRQVEARQWPDLFSIVEKRVKDARARVAQRDRRELWWLYATRSPGYRAFVAENERCLGITQISDAFAFGFVLNRPVIANTLVAFALHRYADFCLLQSRIHESWARFFSSTMKDDLQYAPSDCFDTFPFPWQTGEAGTDVVEASGNAYYQFRAGLMIRNDEGLTKTYNRFHDPDEHDPDILKLRDLHAAMDRAVLDAYGWTDIPTDCEFLLDYEIDEETWSPRKKKPYRYRWPEDVHDEVLARL